MSHALCYPDVPARCVGQFPNILSATAIEGDQDRVHVPLNSTLLKPFRSVSNTSMGYVAADDHLKNVQSRDVAFSEVHILLTLAMTTSLVLNQVKQVNTESYT